MKYLSAREFDELVNVISNADMSSKFQQRNLAIFLVAEYCGLRASEVGLITFSDYNPDEHTIYCKRLKKSISNVLKIVNPRVINVLNDYYRVRLAQPNHGNHLFASKTERPIDRRTLDSLMKFYCSFTSIPKDKWHFHTLKHTRAMELIETDGVDIRDVQWYLGHKYIANTMIYLNYSVNAQKDLYAKIAK